MLSNFISLNNEQQDDDDEEEGEVQGEGKEEIEVEEEKRKAIDFELGVSRIFDPYYSIDLGKAFDTSHSSTPTQ